MNPDATYFPGSARMQQGERRHVMYTREDIGRRFACDDTMARRILALQAAGARHGRLGWYPNGDFSSDADFCHGAGAEIQAIEEALDVDDSAVFDVYAEAHAECSPPCPEMYEVEFSLTTYPEEDSVRGNVLASGDPAEDRAAEDAVIEAIKAGDAWAWCRVVVTATYEDTSTTAHLGQCSFADEKAFKESGYYQEMRKEAYDDLLGVLAAEHAANLTPACESCGIEFAPVEGKAETFTPQCDCSDCTDADGDWTVQP